MSQASQPIPLHERLASHQSRLQINEIVEQEPASEYDSVGLELQAHRTRKGHDLDMASRVLRIRVNHLEAIEADQFDELPGRTYAVGFVRAYAEYLGLDPEDCVRRFKLEYDGAAAPSGDGATKSAKSGMIFPDLREEAHLPTGSIIVILGLLILGVWGGWYLSTADERAFSDLAAEIETGEIDAVADLPTPEEAQVILNDAVVAEAPTEDSEELAIETDGIEEAQVAIAETETAAVAEEVMPEITSPEIQPAESAATTSLRDSQVFGAGNHDARVILRARGDAWVRVEDQEGVVLFEETLQRGDSYRVPNRNGLILATRNAGAVEMIVDGASLGPVGSIGQALLSKGLDANTLVDEAPQQP